MTEVNAEVDAETDEEDQGDELGRREERGSVWFVSGLRLLGLFWGVNSAPIAAIFQLLLSLLAQY